jgi:hypothetical protein
MERTSGKIKTLIAAAAVTTTAGLATILHAIVHDDLPLSIGGLALTLIGLTALILIAVTNTAEERRRLAAAQRAAQDEQARCLAARAANEVEYGRLRQDINAERYANAARLIAEREAMANEFAERRAADIAETMEATVRMFQGGKFAPAETKAGNLIEFPRQHPERQPERARSREHGVVGP